MKIRHDRPQSDLKYHIHAPLFVKVNGGEIVRITEWSLTGLIYPETAGELPSQVSLTIPFQGVYLQFPVQLKPSGHGRELLFEKLTVRQRETLAVFYKSILTGRMATTKDMIVSLDTPVDLVPMEETEAERTAEQGKGIPRIMRALWSMTFYIVMALIIFGVFGNHIWTRLNTIRLDQARIQAPITPYLAPNGAYVDKVAVKPGQKVKRNALLVRLSNPVLDGRVDAVRAEINASERRLFQARDRLRQHEARAGPARLKLLNALLAERHRLQIREFFGGYSLARYIALWQALQAFDAQRSTQIGDYADIRTQLLQIRQQHKDEWGRLKRELSNRKSAARALDVRAKTDGIVAQVLAVKQHYVQRGETLLRLEENRPRQAVGILDERLGSTVFVGMPAEIRINLKGEKQEFPGRIVDIQAVETPKKPGNFTMIVTVEAPGMSVHDSRKMLHPNVPVTLILHRRIFGKPKLPEAAHADS